MGWGWGLGTGLMGSFPILTLCLLALIHVPDIKELRRRRHQRITVHEQGLLYEEGERRLSVPWAEVTSCQIVKSRGVSSSTTYVVTTSQGTFDFNSHLQESRLPESRLLYRLIERYAPSSIDLVQNDEACLDELPTRIPTNSGEQIFHYRSRESRAVLWFYSAFLIILLLLPALLAHFGFGPVHPEQSRGDSLFQQSLSIALPAGWLWCYWRYRSARIVIDDSGITQFGPFGRTTLAWNEIHSYRKRDSTYTVSGYHRKLRFFSMIVRVAVLQEEIRKRATGSSNQDWETKDTDSD